MERGVLAIDANLSDEMAMNRRPKLGEDCLHRPPDAAAIAPTMLRLEFPICGGKVYNAHRQLLHLQI